MNDTSPDARYRIAKINISFFFPLTLPVNLSKAFPITISSPVAAIIPENIQMIAIK